MPGRSSLAALNVRKLDQNAKRESRNREVYLPPLGVYRWWARRSASTAQAFISAFSNGRADRLTIADPFAGGGIIPLSALICGHRVYAQDINPWAAAGLAMMFNLPSVDRMMAAKEILLARSMPLLKKAYLTTLADGSQGMTSHTFRVAVSSCVHCGERFRLFPHALVTRCSRKDNEGGAEAFLACPYGHLFRSKIGNGSSTSCPECSSRVRINGSYTKGRNAVCAACGKSESLSVLASHEWAWEVVLVERIVGGKKTIDFPLDQEIAQAAESNWSPAGVLGKISDTRETRVLLRHGFKNWEDLYPNRQRFVLEELLRYVDESSESENVKNAMRWILWSETEMAGLLSRWDRYYLKSYESMAGHRFNFTTFPVEHNVWGVKMAGRGTFSRRFEMIKRASSWLKISFPKGLVVEEASFTKQGSRALPVDPDLRIVLGDSSRIFLPDAAVDLVFTDPPYHDDVAYDDLSLLFRAWAGISLSSSTNNERLEGKPAETDKEFASLLARVFSEARRILRTDGHLVLTYANRDPAAWVALFDSLQRAGFRAAGCLSVHSENETDVAKRGVRSCRLDLLMDLVPATCEHVEPYRSNEARRSQEAQFLRLVSTTFMEVGSLPIGWERGFIESCRACRFIQGRWDGRSARRKSTVQKTTQRDSRIA
jgi:putative DNA methylase